LYKISQVSRITGLTRRQISHWAKTGLISPTVDHNKARVARLWGFKDLLALRAVRRLLEQNVSLHKVRRVLEFIEDMWPDLENHLTELHFYVIGEGRDVLVLGPGEPFPMSTFKNQGQYAFVIMGEEVRKEVEEAVQELRKAG